MTTITRRVAATAAALTVTGLGAAGSAAAASTADLQREADVLLRQGPPGVLAGVQTDAGDVEARSGLGDLGRAPRCRGARTSASAA